MRRRPFLIMLLALLVAFAIDASSPAPALADSSVLADCNAHQRLTEQHSVAALRAALSSMPADVKEYTNCYDVIQRALLAELGGGHASGTAPLSGSGSGSGGSFVSAPVIIVIGVLILAAGGFGVVAARRRGA